MVLLNRFSEIMIKRTGNRTPRPGWPSVPTALTMLGLAVAVAAWLGWWLPFVETDREPLLFYDHAGYFLDAQAAGGESFFAALRRMSKPLFTWPWLAVWRTTGETLSYQWLLAVNAAGWAGLLMAGWRVLLGQMGVGWAAWAAGVAVIVSTPIFFTLSTTLLPDVAMAAWAVWSTAAAVSWLRSPQRWLRHGLIFGGLAAAGCQIKVLTYFYGAVLILAAAGTILLGGGRGLDRWRARAGGTGWFQTVAFAAVFFSTAGLGWALVFPRPTPLLIRDYHYYSEILDYWQDPALVFESMVWFPLAVHDAVPGILTVLMGGILIGVAIWTMKKARIQTVETDASSRPPTPALWRETGGLLTILAVTIAILYLSLAVRIHLLRAYFFLLILGWAVLASVVEWLVRRQASTRASRLLQWGWCATVVAAALSILSWGQPGSTAAALLTKRFPMLPRMPDTAGDLPSLTPAFWDDTGLEGPYRYLEAAARQTERPRRVFVPHHGALLNAGLLNYRPLARRGWRPGEWGWGASPAIPLEFREASARFGIWHQAGGLPADFFKADYQIVGLSAWWPEVKVDMVFYNNWLAVQLLEANPLYCDGLRMVRYYHDRYGRKIYLVRRERLPTPEAFAQMVGEMARRDYGNPWNIPWLAAACHIPGSDPALRRQLEEMLAPGWKSPVVVAMPAWQEAIAEIQSQWPDLAPPWRYPNLLQRLDY